MFFCLGLMEATARRRRRIRMTQQAGASSDRRRTIDSCISQLTEEGSPQDRPFIALLCPPASQREESNVRLGKRCMNNSYLKCVNVTLDNILYNKNLILRRGNVVLVVLTIYI